jgi:hypothetical protein
VKRESLKVFYLNSQRNKNFSGSFQPYVLIRKKLVIFVHFKGFNIFQKPKSSPLSYFAQNGAKLISDNFYVSGPAPDQNSFIVSFIISACFDEVQGH